jgi:ribose/xylose/arabinose/galactoside ABC-type transport system permease subunit
LRETTYWQATVANQAFWVTVTVVVLCLVTAWHQPDTFATKGNFFNITRNFAAIGIMAMGMTCVIITGGIDLSVGSVMALAAIVAARIMEAGFEWYVAFVAGLVAGAAAGAVNGTLIAYVKLPPFVVTLGMLSIARSAAIVLSENRVIYQFGPGGDTFKAIGGGRISIPWIDGGWLPLSNLFAVLVVLAIVMAIVLKFTAWGRYLFAIGGNEHAARLTGIPVDRIKLQVYMLAGTTAALRHHERRLYGLGVQRHWPDVRALRHRRDGHRRRQPDGRQGQHLRRLHRRGPDLFDPQQPDHVRRRCQLVRLLRRAVHHPRGSARASARPSARLSGAIVRPTVSLHPKEQGRL